MTKMSKMSKIQILKMKSKRLSLKYKNLKRGGLIAKTIKAKARRFKLKFKLNRVTIESTEINQQLNWQVNI